MLCVWLAASTMSQSHALLLMLLPVRRDLVTLFASSAAYVWCRVHSRADWRGAFSAVTGMYRVPGGFTYSQVSALWLSALCRRYMTPLLVSLAVQLEPVLGPALGWSLGVAAAPGLFTWIGGSIVLLATLGATIATGRRQQQEEAAAAEAEDRLLIKNKSMRLPSSSTDGSNTSYVVVAAADEGGASEPGQVGGEGGGSSGGMYAGRFHGLGVGINSDMDVVVGEREQLLPSSSQLSHHTKPHARDHHEIELPDIHEQR